MREAQPRPHAARQECRTGRNEARLIAARARTLAIPVASALFALTAGCSKNDAPEKARIGVTAAGSAQPSMAGSTVASSAPAPASDIDVSALQKKLRCGGTTHKDACRLLDEFANGRKWQLRIPSGHGRWAGNGFSIETGKNKAEILLFSAREVPTNSIAPGDLPYRVGTGPLPEGMRAAGLKMVGALSRDDTVGKGNPALAYLSTWSSNREYSVVPTAGESIRLVAEHATYIRQGKGQKIVLVQPHVDPSNPSSGDGLYAELWPTSW